MASRIERTELAIENAVFELCNSGRHGAGKSPAGIHLVELQISRRADAWRWTDITTLAAEMDSVAYCSGMK